MSKHKNSSVPSESKQSPIQRDLPFLTADIPGLGGVIKTVPEDFRVEEIPQYEPSDEGTHIYALIEKRNMTTADAIAEIAKAVGVRKIDVGYAGRKDARAVTRQWISIEHVDPDKVAAYKSRVIRVLEVRRHGNKLKVGHLAGNRFILRVRKINVPLAEALPRAQAAMETLVKVGVPNYFGPQRFGYRQDSHLLGEAAVKRDAKRFFDTLLGRPELGNEAGVIRARTLSQQGGDHGA